MTACHGSVVWRSDVDAGTKLVALTIDDSPRLKMNEDDVLELILLLKRYNARVTFFVIWTAFKKSRTRTVDFFMNKIKSMDMRLVCTLMGDGDA